MAAFSTPRGALGMLFTIFVLLQAVVASQHHAHHPVHRSPAAMEAHLQETRAILEERANNIAIRGAADNAQHPRLEIRELQKKADQWNLYLLAMERFKAKPKNDRMSWYQIAGQNRLGLHIVPSTDWCRCSRTSLRYVEQPRRPPQPGWKLPSRPPALRHVA